MRSSTGICLRRGADILVDSETTRVHFLPVPRDVLEDYANSGEPMDKAGAYAIQGQASRFIDRIEGCYFNVVGLPVFTRLAASAPIYQRNTAAIAVPSTASSTLHTCPDGARSPWPPH
jgi:predicted house-cleaning NTP pyrophosphatase (Maf/HAM1 superfamily)